MSARKKKEVKSDITTKKRYEYSFDREHEIREAYHKNCDCSLNMSKSLSKEIENSVQNWLDSSGIESPHFEITLTPKTQSTKDSFSCSQTLLFIRSEIALKTCSNNWEIFHIANSRLWPRIISSKPKLKIQLSDSVSLVHLRNEILSTSYNQDSSNECQRAQRIVEENK